MSTILYAKFQRIWLYDSREEEEEEEKGKEEKLYIIYMHGDRLV